MNNSYKLGLQGKTALVLGGLLFLGLMITSVASYLQSRSIAEQKAMEFEQSKLTLLKHGIEGALIGHSKNLMSLHDIPPIQSILRARIHNGIDPESGDTLQEWRQRLATIFFALLSNHPQYLQLRFISAAGDELVRVEKSNGARVTIVANNKLQNKSDSLYVSKTLKLGVGEVYYSDVTLNREHGVIQVPHIPVLRLASPVYNTDKQLAGLIVMNLSTDKLFSNVHSESNGVQRNIVDDKGYFIKHVDSFKTFGFERGIDYRLQDIEPELAEIATSQDQFIRYHDEHKKVDGFQKIYFSPLNHSRYWLLILHVPEQVVFAEIAGSLNKMLFVSLFVGLFGLVLIIWFVSRNILAPVVVLATATSKLQGGDLAVRVDAASVRDEFYTLYTAINSFAENQQYATSLLKQEVESQTERLSAVIDNIVDGIITINEKGAIASFNPAAEKIFGYKITEIFAENIKKLMPEPYHSEHDGYLEHYMKTGEKKVIGIIREVTGLHKNGSTFPMELAVNEISIDGSRHFVGIVRDITERKRIEQMQKEFVSIVSHELRTPLTSIRGSLGLILGGVSGELPEKAKALLTIANNNSERLIHLINDILDMEKISAGKMQFDYTVTNLVTVVQHAVESNKGYADQLHVSLEFNSGPDNEIMVRIDEKRMAQVMANLLSNAAKYSPTNDQVEISLEASEKTVRVSVHDHGKGISEEFKSRIFSKFAQADSSDTRQKGGTGLGLNITKVIVEEHGGSIGFDSDEGKGTTFYVDLPLWHEERRVEKTRDEAVSGKPRVLIVEDDKDVSKLLSIMLEKEGYRCDQAFSYQEAVQQIQDNHYSAVTLDLIIPGGSGISLLRELRENEATRELPVIVVSVKANEGKLEVEGDAFSMVDWIEKPIDEDRLFEAIRSGLSDVKCGGKCILHVEDDPDIAMVVDSLLGTECQVVHATTLEQARQLMSDEVFDLVLLDIGLPDGSGLDLLPELDEQGHETPVIIFSAQDVSSDIATQVKSILVKSKTDNKQLIQIIRSTINKKT